MMEHGTVMKQGPLAGLRVVEFAGLGPAPFACMLLALLLCLTSIAALAESTPSKKTTDLTTVEVTAENLSADSGFFIRIVNEDETEYQKQLNICGAEVAKLAAAAPGFPPAEIIPNCLHLPDYQSTKSPSYQSTQSPSQHLIFTGAFTYHVNYEGARWFVEQVLPLVQA